MPWKWGGVALLAPDNDGEEVRSGTGEQRLFEWGDRTKGDPNYPALSHLTHALNNRAFMFPH